IAPLAVGAIAFAGLGLLPLVPVVCAPTLVWLTVAVARRVSRPNLRAGVRILAGAGISFLLLVCIEAPKALTRQWVQTAATGDADHGARAISRLRLYGNEECLQRLASGDTGTAIGPFWMLLNTDEELSTEDARAVWFRVHGTPFRGPLSQRSGTWFRGDGGFDLDRGGTTVGVSQRGLELAGSRIDAAVDGTAGVAYLEWTFEIANTNQFGELEARAIVDLPDEAVVSRATLWVGGEEREAAYARTAVARGAYQEVAIAQRRDPLLVTSAGDDLVLVQAFPVTAGSTLKCKLGITVPLELEARTARMPWPRLVDQNFEIAPKLTHSVWVESHEELASQGLDVVRAATGWEARGALAAGALGGSLAPPSLRVGRDDDGSGECALDETRTLVCEFAPPSAKAVAAPVIAIDGSRALRRWADPIAQSLRAEFASDLLRVVVAEDAGARSLDFGGNAGLAELRSSAWDGGVDNAPALEEAWDRARELGTDVVWLCGPQPVLLSPMLGLQQRFEREAAGPRIVCCMLAPGENRVLTELAGEARIERVPFEGDVTDSLRRARGRVAWERRWSVVESRSAGARPGPKHLAALWASARVEELLRANPNDVERRGEATLLAQQHHLVTRVSGAVVLENAAQFAANDLTPAESESLPSVPEPEVALLLLVVLAAALTAMTSRRARTTG
ncbi:MAG TPA: VIT domain-containing protein, partial [Planctomycetota bacterium]|nr:VIT domain-containing protein [Planctomycetota bacterium]